VFLLPFLGVAIALFLVAFKIVVIGGLVFVAVWLLRRSRRREEAAS